MVTPLKLKLRMVARLVVLPLAAILCLTSGQAISQEETKLLIWGTNQYHQGGEFYFFSKLTNPPTVMATGGYKPKVFAPGSNAPNAIAVAHETIWTPPTTFTWNFGDGTASVIVKERTYVTHRFAEPGTYTVTLTASNLEGSYATKAHTVTVTPRDPAYVNVGSYPLKEDGATIKFDAAPQYPADDDNYFVWQFGDGKSAEGKSLLEVTHRYAQGGNYEGLLTHTNETTGKSYDKPFKVFVADSSITPSSSSQAAADGLPDTVVDEFTATYSGNNNGNIDAEVFGGAASSIYLAQRKNGSCRVIFHATHDEKLIFIRGIVDIKNFPEAPTVYNITPTRFGIQLHSDPSIYKDMRSTFLGGPLGESMLDPEKLRPIGTGTVEELTKYSWAGGTMKLTVVPGKYMLGEIRGSLKAKIKKTVRVIQLDGKFSFRTGLTPFVKAGCEATPFEVEKTHPKNGWAHQNALEMRQDFKFYLTHAPDPESITPDRIQIGYPDAEGNWVATPGRLQILKKRVKFVPNEPLRAAVHYTARLRSGEQGIRSNTGKTLADKDGSGWRDWNFSTEIDFSSTKKDQQTLSCHVLQSVRDKPLIAGKPAIPRVYAGWIPHPDIHTDAQVKAFDARITLVDKNHKELASARHRFVRPDLWQEQNISTASAQHTAQIFGFTPQKETPLITSVKLEVTRRPGEKIDWMYNTKCMTPIWSQQPKLTVDTFVLMGGVIEDKSKRGAAMAAVQQLLKDVGQYAWQTLPIHEIDMRTPKRIELEELDSRPALRNGLGMEKGIDTRCEAGCWLTGGGMPSFGGIENWLRSKSTADIILLLAPTDLFGVGGTTQSKQSGSLAVISMGFEVPSLLPLMPSQQALGARNTYNRRVNAIVHEFGHALTLDHRPIANWLYQRAPIIAMRETARNEGSSIWFEGIEAFRMDPSGTKGWNMSSVEGTQSGTWLVPLMFPGTIDYRYAMPTLDQYQIMQDFLKKKGL